jgi:hypothetical protein
MKLFIVHMYLVVTLKGPSSSPRPREGYDSRKLAVIAEDEAQAIARATGWLEEQSRSRDLRRIEFHQNRHSDVLAVRLANSKNAISVSEVEQGVVRL